MLDLSPSQTQDAAKEGSLIILYVDPDLEIIGIHRLERSFARKGETVTRLSAFHSSFLLEEKKLAFAHKSVFAWAIHWPLLPAAAWLPLFAFVAFVIMAISLYPLPKSSRSVLGWISSHPWTLIFFIGLTTFTLCFAFKPRLKGQGRTASSCELIVLVCAGAGLLALSCWCRWITRIPGLLDLFWLSELSPILLPILASESSSDLAYKSSGIFIFWKGKSIPSVFLTCWNSMLTMVKVFLRHCLTRLCIIKE